jgi:vitamin B12 transporter
VLGRCLGVCGLMWALPALAGVDAGLPLVELAPIVVASPVDDNRPNPSAVEVRDPTAQTTRLDVRPRRGEATDTSTLLLASPGVVVHDSGGAGQKKTLSLRGSAANGTLVLLDGVPLGGPGQAVDLSRIPVAALDGIEVLRGSASSRYGPGALGGVVNLITRVPTGPSVFGTLSHGSFGQTTGSAGASAKLLGGELLAVGHGLFSEGGFDYRYDEQPTLAGNPLVTRTRLNNGARQGGGLLRFRRAFGRTRLDVIGEGFGEERGLAGPAANPSAAATQASGRGVASARVTHAFDSGGTLSLLTSGRLERTAFTGSPFVPTGNLSQLESSFGSEVVLQKPFLERHLLTALVSSGGDWLSNSQGSAWGWGRVGAMVGDEVLFFDGALALNASARVDVAGRFVVFSPKVGASLVLPHGFEVKANVGLASRPPSFAELYVVQGTLLPNPTLVPERAWNVDASVRWAHPKASLLLGGFATRYDDLITYEYSPPFLAKPFNFMGASTVGVEVEGQATPVAWLSATASYTFMHTENLRDDGRYFGRALPYRPAHRVAARLEAGPEWLKGRAEVLAQSEQFTNRTQTLALAARTFVNVGLTVAPLTRPRVSVTAEVKNLLDISSQDVDGYPLPPRAAFLSFAVTWDESKRRGEWE